MKRMAELVLGHEGAARRAAEHQNVEPADVIGDEQAVRAERLAVHARRARR